MRELIQVLRELLEKSKDGTANYLDWLKALDVVIHLVLDSQQGFGAACSAEEEEEARALAALLIEDASGEPAGGMKAGPVVSILLPVLLKFLLNQVLIKASGDEEVA